MHFFGFKGTGIRPAKLIFLTFVVTLAGCSGTRKMRERDQQIASVIKTARSFTGTPYKYGGTTRSGIDCSGLMVNAYQSVKHSLPRTSDAQYLAGEKVKVKDIQPGDLVFFALEKKKKDITHVGLVTEVRGNQDIRFIHATTKLGVVETNLFQDYYWKGFRGARRILETKN